MLALDDYPYRVFLSYSRNDDEAARKLRRHLKRLHLQPVWDKQTPPGWPFLNEIKKQIAHSHLFISLFTPQSAKSCWVNHEIGYAMGQNVPILPLCIGKVPDGMVEALEALADQNIEKILRQLNRSRINLLVQNWQTTAVYECADLVQHRSLALIEHCKQVESFTTWQNYKIPAKHKNAYRLRHRAAFSSFCIPSSKHDPLWNQHDPRNVHDNHSRGLLSEERTRLEQYACQFGCDLILWPSVSKLTPPETAARIEVFRSFLQKMHDKHVDLRIVFDKSALGENLIIVGDWFLAESLTPSVLKGYRHTTLTCHAPTVLKRLNEFDDRFEDHVKNNHCMDAAEAIAWLEERLTSMGSSSV
jgi:hypothetical protein